MIESFRRVFAPTPEEQIRDCEMLLELHTAQIGFCSTCANHIPSNMPGFVTDYGECRAGSSNFAAKVCSLEQLPCQQYSEEPVEPILREIERLKRVHPPEGEEDNRGI